MTKKQAVFTIVACSVAALFLIGVLAVGLTSDGFGLGKLSHQDSPAPQEKNGKYRYEYVWDLEESEVTGLDVEWVNGKVELKTGTGSEIKIIESAGWKLDDGEKLRLSSSGGVLKVKWEDRIINFSLFQNKYKDLTIEVPESLAGALAEISCSTTSGDITAQGFTGAELEFSSASGGLSLSDMKGEEAEFSTTSGDLELTEATFSEGISANTVSGRISLVDVTAPTLSFDTVSGEVSCVGSAKKVDSNSISGAVRCELDACPEEGDFDSVSGEIILTIPENKGFEAEYSSISGSFSSDFPVTGDTGKSGRALYSAGESKLSFSTTSGNMAVKRK